MFIFHADRNRLSLKRRELVTSGSVNVCPVRFSFSPDWDGLERTAVFRAGGVSVSVPLSESGECSIPWEVLGKPSAQLFAGVYGTRGTQVVLPTQWVYLGTILEGAAPGPEAQPPPAPAWQLALEGKGDTLDYTPDGELGLWAGDKLLSAVPVLGGGGEGAGDHRRLTHRGDEAQHPISAISGLAQELERIPAPVEPLTNQDLEELLT